MAQHTPGPWHPHNERKEGEYPLWTVWPKEGSGYARVCTVVQCDRDKANTRLIAAAPDLLAALKALLALDDTHGEGLWIHAGNNSEQNDLEKHLGTARVAIAKAEGKNP